MSNQRHSIQFSMPQALLPPSAPVQSALLRSASHRWAAWEGNVLRRQCSVTQADPEVAGCYTHNLCCFCSHWLHTPPKPFLSPKATELRLTMLSEYFMGFTFLCFSLVLYLLAFTLLNLTFECWGLLELILWLLLLVYPLENLSPPIFTPSIRQSYGWISR